MRYLLDTNIIIYVLKDPAGQIARRLAETSTSQLVICSVVEAELYYGAMRYGIPQRRKAALDGFLLPFQSLPFDSACVARYATIRSQLEAAGQIIGGNDLLIAAIAMANDLTLVTHNGGEFSRVSGLKFEDWAA
jgi:tRNA(fMet)-specific endonuclease VapC